MFIRTRAHTLIPFFLLAIVANAWTGLTDLLLAGCRAIFVYRIFRWSNKVDKGAAEIRAEFAHRAGGDKLVYCIAKSKILILPGVQRPRRLTRGMKN
jgi:hypothetical protein